MEGVRNRTIFVRICMSVAVCNALKLGCEVRRDFDLYVFFINFADESQI